MAEQNNDSSYKDAVKATTLFGGVQIFNIFIRILRSKAIAVLLGPSGMGIAGLFRSTIETISAFTNLGLGQSAVRNIAEANSTNDDNKISVTIIVFRRIIWYTGIAGAILCAAFSSYLSNVTFGDNRYSFAFIILSISILLLQLTSGQTAILQGLQKYKYLAKSNVYGSVIGLCFTIPLYYFWGIDAVVPVLLLTYISSFLCAKYFARTVRTSNVVVSRKEQKVISRDMIKLGIVLSLQSFLTLFASYIIRVFIRKNGGLEDVGLYNAGFTIVNTYIGMIFTAMATDYYPRLVKCAKDDIVFKRTINNQAEVVFLLMTPMIVIFMIFIRLVITILYSNQFLPIEGMVYWAIAAMIFKAMAWGLSFGLVSKGKIKAYSICEFCFILYGLIFNIIGYKYWGLIGLGISYFFMYLVYFIHICIVSNKLLLFKYSKEVLKYVLWAVGFIGIILVENYGVGIICDVNDKYLFVKYSIGIIICSLAIFVYYRELSKKIPISAMIGKIVRKK